MWVEKSNEEGNVDCYREYVKNSVKFFEDQEEMAWKAHFVISDELFIVTEEEEEKGTGDGRFCVWGEGSMKAFLSDSCFHSETRE